MLRATEQRPVSRKSRKLFGPEKPFVKLRPPYSVKLVFSYVVKGKKINITAKSRSSRHLRFEDTKRIMSPEMRPKSFGTFEKRAPSQFVRLLLIIIDSQVRIALDCCKDFRNLHTSKLNEIANKRKAYPFKAKCLFRRFSLKLYLEGKR